MAKGEAKFGVGGYTHGMQYDEDIARQICERLAAGETYAAISRDEGMPKRQTVTRWRAANSEFAAAYEEAMLEGCHALLDETLAIADDTEEDSSSRKVRIWTRHELIKRKRPDVFSDKVNMQHSGDASNPVVVQAIERRIVKA